MQASDAQSEKYCHSLKTTTALALCQAALFAASFAPLNLWPLSFISLFPLAFLAINARSTTKALLIVFIVQMGMWLAINSWIYNVTELGFVALSAYLSCFAVLFVWLYRKITQHRKLSAIPPAIVIPILWVGIECLRGEIIFHGYPWYLLAHPLIEWPVLAQTADIFGAYWISFIAAMVSGALVGLLLAKKQITLKRSAVTFACLTIIVHIANISYGYWRVNQDTLSPGPVVLAIQTNLLQDNKIRWDTKQQPIDFAEFISLSRKGHSQATRSGLNVDLIVWPETMVPGKGFEKQSLDFQRSLNLAPGDYYLSALWSLENELQTALLVGSPSYFGLGVTADRYTWDQHYNSAYLLSGKSDLQRYDKRVLTPFGETMPYISSWPWLEQKLLSLGPDGMMFNLDSNPQSKLLRLDTYNQSVLIATPICFEDTVAWLCREMVYRGGQKTANVLINLSNDGWFGTSIAGRHQHTQIARFRCIENRVPMVRAVNTGQSVAIDSCGKLISLPTESRYPKSQTQGWFAVELLLDSRSTVFGRIGDSWAWCCFVGTIVACGWSLLPTRQGK
ncbi:MAG: apolipoprotein N-acyltransferase [Planctomycetes bacterium]|nr:apolipoprotein N-acyltransferase [Planctomycetota bacterium]